MVDEDEWRISSLGLIEHVAWPHVSGWVADFGSPEERATWEVHIEALGKVSVHSSVRRPDVQAFLGEPGVAGFQLDLGDSLGYAAPEGSPLALIRGSEVLDVSEVSKSPIRESDGCCLDASGHDGLVDPAAAAGLATRLRREAGPEGAKDWLEELDGLGIQDNASSTRQWAELLRIEHGLSPQHTAALLARRAVGRLRVPVLDPLPDHVAATTDALSSTLPARIREWSATVITDRGGEPRDRGSSSDAEASVSQVCVAGLVNHPSGLGQNAVHSIRALGEAGIHACTAPFFPAPGGWNASLAPDVNSAQALADHSVLLHVPIDRVVQSLSAQPALMGSPRVIGYFMWETALVPRQMHRSLDLVDEIWTATDFVAEAFRAVTSTPVHVTGHAVDVSQAEPMSREELGIPDDAFVVHYSFDANSTVARKNPSAALDAFKEAFGGDPSAVFLLKVRNMQQAEHLARSGDPHARGLMERLARDPSIRLLTGEWSYGRSLALIAMADCLISLHRSEGYGYSIAEAMALETPVVGTDYSGSSDLLSASTGWPVPCEVTGVLPEEYFYWEPGMVWAEPDVHAAAQALQEVRAGEGVRERVQAARAHVEATATIESLGERYVAGLWGA